MIAAAIALALAAAAVHGTWNVLVKVSGDPMATFQRATIAAALIITPPTAVVWMLTGRPGYSPAAAGLCALSAAFELTYLWLLATAYRRGELSVVYPIARGSAPLLAVVAGLGLLHERLTAVQLAGVGLLLLGILAVAVSQSGGRATLPALLTGVAIASYTAVDRVGVRLSTPWLYGWLLVVLIAVGLPVSTWVAAHLTAARRGLVEQPRASPSLSRAQAILIGVFMWGGYLLVLWALSLAPLSVVAPVRETAVVGVAVWGVWRLRERKSAAVKLSGAAATLAGVALLAL
ncbi:MAG TPA: EamA family transporter [Candidatus Dormibacteraeota bacterium]|nr:EamA family transporter [Candidatus Dormibacteraeota bacterium]